LSNPFLVELNDLEIAYVDTVLDGYELITVDRELPSSMDELATQMYNTLLKVGEEIKELSDIVFALASHAESGAEMKNMTVKTLIYTYGVTLFRLALRKEIPLDGLHHGGLYLEYAVTIDSQYYQAYNRLGDTWFWLEDCELDAIGCYKASLVSHGKGESSTSMYVGGGSERFKGNNYFKIGMCFVKLGRYKEARLFLKYAQYFIEEDDEMYSELGFESWEKIRDFIDMSEHR
jgi:hypothetical protein